MKSPLPCRSALLLLWTVVFMACAWPVRGQLFNPAYDLALLPGEGPTATDAVFFGATGNDGLGYISCVADLNGDGVDDLIASSYGAAAGSPPRTAAGKVSVWFGRASLAGTMDLATTPADLTILGASPDDTLTYPNGAGKRSMKVGDMNGDGKKDLILGSMRADGPSESRNFGGEAYIIFGRAVFPPVLDLAVKGSGGADVTIYGAQALDTLTSSDGMATGDLNGDGRDDLIVGAPSTSNIGGHGYIIFGRALFAPVMDLATPAIAGGIVTIMGSTGNGLFGYNGAIATGDVNGDGTADLVLGDIRSYSMGGTRTESGEAYIIFGRRSPAVFPDTLDLTVRGSGGADVTIYGASPYDGLSGGYILDPAASFADPLLAVADVNGDGTADVILGTPTGDGPGEARSNCGETYVIFGRKSPAVFPVTLDLAVHGAGGADVTIYGATADDQLGGPGSLVLADVNGDGTTDVIMGAASADGPLPSQAYSGAIYIVFGRKAPAVFPTVLDLAVHGSGGADVTIYGGDQATSITSNSALTAGDVNGDGVADLIFGAPFIWTFLDRDHPRFESGEAFIVFGRKSPLTFPAVLSPADADITIYGKDRDQLGAYGNFRVGDLNGDGMGDLILTNSYAYGPGETRWNGGKVHVLFGRPGVSARSPEIAVEQPAGTGALHGGSVDFGGVLTGGEASLTFLIKNTGNADLTGIAATVSGADASLFTVTTAPAPSIPGPSGTTAFTVKFAPVAGGSRNADLFIANNDSDESPFHLTLTGTSPALTFSAFSLSVPPGGGPGWRVLTIVEGGAFAAGATLELQYSEDLTVWTTLATAIADSSGNASFDTVDLLAGPTRFYRVRRP